MRIGISVLLTSYPYYFLIMGRKRLKQFRYVFVIRGKEYECTGEFTEKQAEEWYNKYGKLFELKGYKLKLKKLKNESIKSEEGSEIS